MGRPIKVAVIANGATASGEVDLAGLRAGAVLFPAAFTGATVSFQMPDSGGGWATLATITLTKVLSNWVALTEAQAFALGDNFKIVSSGAEGSERTLYVAAR